MKIKDCRLNHGIGSIEILADAVNPVIRGWMNYFMPYGKREAIKSLDYVNQSLVRFVMRFYKKKAGNKQKAWHFIAILQKQCPDLFYHWTYEILISA